MDTKFELYLSEFASKIPANSDQRAQQLLFLLIPSV